MNVLLVSLGSEARQPHQEDVPSSTRKTYEYLLRGRLDTALRLLDAAEGRRPHHRLRYQYDQRCGSAS